MLGWSPVPVSRNSASTSSASTRIRTRSLALRGVRSPFSSRVSTTWWRATLALAGCPSPPTSPGRLSSSELEAGLDWDLSLCWLMILWLSHRPTLLLYYTASVLKPDGAVMVAGSHNPSEYDGFKIVLGKAPSYAADIWHLGAIADYEFGTPDRGTAGTCRLCLAPTGGGGGRRRRPKDPL